MKIGINFSGGIADINELKRKYAEVLYSIKLPIEETEFDNATKQGLRTEQYHTIQKLVYNDEYVLNGAKEVPDAINNMRKLMVMNHDLSIIVSRFSLEKSEEHVRNWLLLKSQGDFYDLEIIHLKKEYNDIRFLNEKNIEVLIDDNFRRLELLSKNKKSNIGYFFFFRKPYNTKYYVEEDWNRFLVNNWNEIYQKVVELKNFSQEIQEQDSIFSQRVHQH